MGEMPYIGAKISLISKGDIRYEGTLYSIDMNESTIALHNGGFLLYYAPSLCFVGHASMDLTFLLSRLFLPVQSNRLLVGFVQ